jgi:hypothetical protein
MTKKEILAKIKTGDKDKEAEFKIFMLSQGFKEGISKSGNFGSGSPVYYKKVADETFLAFNIPYYGKTKNASFYSDFWTIKASSEKDFLVKGVNDANLIEIRLGFTMEHIDIYLNKLKSYNDKVFGL